MIYGSLVFQFPSRCRYFDGVDGSAASTPVGSTIDISRTRAFDLFEDTVYHSVSYRGRSRLKFRRWLTGTIWVMFLLTLLLVGSASIAPGRMGSGSVLAWAVIQMCLSPLVAWTLRRVLGTWRGFLLLVATTCLFLVGLGRWLNSSPTQWHSWHVVMASIALMLGLDLVFVGMTTVLMLCWYGEGAKALALGWLSFPLIWLFMTNRYGSRAAMFSDSVTNQLAIIMALMLTSVLTVAGTFAVIISVIRLTLRELMSSPKAIPTRHLAQPPPECLPSHHN